MNGRHRQLQLDHGRRLGYACYGDPGGRPLLYFHGLPSSRLEAVFCAAAARRLGIGIIAPDRPGYGLSDFQPQRRIADWPGDVGRLVDSLGLERFAVLGVSGGGPYALACAWKMPGRISAVKVVGGLAPLDRPETLAAMNLRARLAFVLARRSPALLRLSYGAAVPATVRHWPALAAAWLRFSGNTADWASLAAEGATARMLAALREGLRQGDEGALWDLALYAGPWGFPLEDIKIPVELWQGTADRIVPSFHARVLANALARPTLKLVPGAGHYSLPLGHADEILASLALRSVTG